MLAWLWCWQQLRTRSGKGLVGFWHLCPSSYCLRDRAGEGRGRDGTAGGEECSIMSCFDNCIIFQCVCGGVFFIQLLGAGRSQPSSLGACFGPRALSVQGLQMIICSRDFTTRYFPFFFKALCYCCLLACLPSTTSSFCPGAVPLSGLPRIPFLSLAAMPGQRGGVGCLPAAFS